MTDLQVAVHRDPVWRERSDFIIAVEIEPGDTGKDTEQLWARKIDESHFELCCIPFFTYHLALGDVVRTEPIGDRLYMVAEVTQPSGRFVFRVWFGGTTEPRQDILNKLESLGGLLEWSSNNLLAVDASDTDHAQLIADYLRACSAEDKLVYEPGKTA